jgi:acetaldehyde dehydrogenase/alcohol dehydrogenase
MDGFAQYKYPNAKWRYAKIADFLNLGGNTEEEKVNNLIKKIDSFKETLEIPLSIQEYGIKESEFLSKLDDMVEDAFDDQCTGANPRYPLMSELREMYLSSYYGSEKYANIKKNEEKNNEKVEETKN